MSPRHASKDISTLLTRFYSDLSEYCPSKRYITKLIVDFPTNTKRRLNHRRYTKQYSSSMPVAALQQEQTASTIDDSINRVLAQIWFIVKFLTKPELFSVADIPKSVGRAATRNIMVNSFSCDIAFSSALASQRPIPIGTIGP